MCEVDCVVRRRRETTRVEMMTKVSEKRENERKWREGKSLDLGRNERRSKKERSKRIDEGGRVRIWGERGYILLASIYFARSEARENPQWTLAESRCFRTSQ